MAIDLTQIPSPCFVLEEKLLRQNLETLKYVQQESGAKIILALKGFAMHSTFPMVRQYLPGTTASSLNEARLGAEVFGGEVHAYSPAWLDAEFEQLMQHCGHITFNSLSQWEHFKPQIVRSAKKISCAIRINPEYSEVETDLYNPCAPGSRLGVPAETLGDTLPEGIEGLHFHALCENGAETLEKVLEAVEEKFGHLLRQAKWLNMGGGHAITRKGYNLDLLITLIRNLKAKYQVEVILEPGSAVGWETGYLVSTVVDIVENKGKKVALLDVSFSAHMPDCIEMPYKPKVWGAAIDDERTENRYILGGLTCLAGDAIGDYTFEKPLSIGDKLVFNDMIHYTMVKTTTFNGVNLPNIGIWKEDNRFQLVRQFGYEDFKNRLS